MNPKKALFFVLLIALVCTAERCPDELQTVAEVLHDAAVVTGEVQDIAIAASGNDVITKEDSDVFISKVTVPLLTAIGKGNQTVALLIALDSQDKSELLDILPPVIEAFGEVVTDENLGIIKNEGTRASIELTLQGVLATLKTVQAVTEVKANEQN